ncbi:hypothetical protein [Allorhodopirellula solitaria]|uniref:Uncharacterized protein n=1 Tax=Allorhodopirellula solitaria TaxID=2527987 RepID=A0A5C5XWM9_9BACT|nr:hypothetical protein [Allorhodopirellula solitaria]TWT67350.1 hypothetical protein CA85_22000 [Allorhodopirellula solitaria]
MALSYSSGKKKTTAAGVAIAILIALYSLVRPSINDATGWSLPAIAQSQSSSAPSQSESNGTTDPSAQHRSAPPKSDSLQSASGTDVPAAVPGARAPSSPANTDDPRVDPTANPSPTDAGSVADPSLKYGLLKEIGTERYVSPAGLLYTPGSAEGHRLEHLRRHTEDQPNRPGSHGVFDGGMEGALKTIDQAYENAKIGKRTTKRTDRDRTIYTSDMGRRVGYVGGREGNQRHKPMARRVQIVLEGNRVITAFPR